MNTPSKKQWLSSYEEPTHVHSFSMPDNIKKALAKELIIAVNNTIGMDIAAQISMSESIAKKAFSLSKDFENDYEKLISDPAVAAIYIDNLPSFTGITKFALNRLLALVLGVRFGMPFQFREQHNGILVPELTPKKGSIGNTNSSPEDFGSHTDDAYIDAKFRTKYIGLLGVENEQHTPTGYSPIARIVESLSEREIDILKQPVFQFRQPFSFVTDSDNKWSESKPIIYFDEHGLLSVQCPTYNTRIDPNCEIGVQRVFEKFKKVVEESVNWVIVDPSTYFIFKNDKGLHQRKAIGGKRTIFRTYWHDNLARLMSKAGHTGFVFSLSDLKDDTRD